MMIEFTDSQYPDDRAEILRMLQAIVESKSAIHEFEEGEMNLRETFWRILSATQGNNAAAWGKRPS